MGEAASKPHFYTPAEDMVINTLLDILGYWRYIGRSKSKTNTHDKSMEMEKIEK